MNFCLKFSTIFLTKSPRPLDPIREESAAAGWPATSTSPGPNGTEEANDLARNQTVKRRAQRQAEGDAGRGPQFAAVLGFVAGVLLDLAPPADHVAGRWALALVVVGYVAGRVRQDVRPTATAVVVTVAASSFVGTSIFALSGLLLRDPVLSVPDLLQVILVAVVWDVVLTPFVLPLVMRMFHRLEPARAPA